ncbi:hypothetical protein CesoFtcFv8_017401 [Champsocephalus esox]|uniref:Uncharacterized protein n=1 Tax=Champsocephalus esox TaxID=159716 RepID=A0AAN8BJF3_9TELE|nr:hypothetical protein CesoFtcFv8_017401 [Champsocephalus esox]
MCSRTSARRDRRAAMMFHYIDYADTAVRTRNRQREENGGKREKENRRNRKRAGEQPANKYRQREGTEMGANTEKRSKCKHEREDMRDREREVKRGGVCAGYSWQRDSQSQLPV